MTTNAPGLPEQAASSATRSAGTFLARRRADRKDRLLAMDLARQVGGRVSFRVPIAGERYHVVWRGEEAVETVPRLPDTAGPLAERPELIGFTGRRVAPPEH